MMVTDVKTAVKTMTMTMMVSLTPRTIATPVSLVGHQMDRQIMTTMVVKMALLKIPTKTMMALMTLRISAPQVT
jgi:hypothetical protein